MQEIMTKPIEGCPEEFFEKLLESTRDEFSNELWWNFKKNMWKIFWKEFLENFLMKYM